MKRTAFFLLLGSLHLFSFEIAKNVPRSINPGTYSTVTKIPYYEKNGLSLDAYVGYDELKVARRSYKHNQLFDYSDWNEARLFPDRQRELAYRYYGDIPGVVWIERTFFVDETEIANVHWQEFLQATGRSAPSTGFTTLPEDYYSNPQFRFFPVTGITYQEALEFCRWRTEIVSSEYNRIKGHQKSDESYTIFHFRLPTEQEWEKCAGYGLDIEKYPYGFVRLKTPVKFSISASSYLSELSREGLSPAQMEQQLQWFNRQKKEDYVINCKRETNTFLNLKTPFQIWSFPSNQFGIYNLLGNVAEMVEQEGIMKGGSWLDPIENCQIKRRQSYSQSAENLGFRCVCVLIWPNKK
jgi:formylglycine-generating enzyme required for sulfatase activity